MDEGRASQALERQDIQVLFSELPGGASLYLGFMAHEGNCLSLFLQKYVSKRVELVVWTFCTVTQWLESQDEEDDCSSLFAGKSELHISLSGV